MERSGLGRKGSGKSACENVSSGVNPGRHDAVRVSVEGGLTHLPVLVRDAVVRPVEALLHVVAAHPVRRRHALVAARHSEFLVLLGVLAGFGCWRGRRALAVSRLVGMRIHRG